MPTEEREKRARREAERVAKQQEQQPHVDAILDYPMESGQEEIIQRAIGVINSNEVGNLLAQIDVRQDREEVIQKIFTRMEDKEPEVEIYELGEAQPAVNFRYEKPEAVEITSWVHHYISPLRQTKEATKGEHCQKPRQRRRSNPVPPHPEKDGRNTGPVASDRCKQVCRVG